MPAVDSTARPLGVMGGTFDPPHLGHLVVANEATYQLGLERLLFVVANEPWQKSSRSVSAAGHRLAMVAAAVAGHDRLEASAIEIERGGPSYTADTVAALRRAHPGREIVVILGRDAAAGLDTWVRGDEVRETARLVVAGRPGEDHLGPPPGWPHQQLQVPMLEVSSTELRARFAEGRPVRYLVPDAVIDYAVGQDLYREA